MSGPFPASPPNREARPPALLVSLLWRPLLSCFVACPPHAGQPRLWSAVTACATQNARAHHPGDVGKAASYMDYRTIRSKALSYSVSETEGRVPQCTTYCALAQAVRFYISVSGRPKHLDPASERRKQKTKNRGGAGAQPSESVPVEKKIREKNHEVSIVGFKTKSRGWIFRGVLAYAREAKNSQKRQ